MLGITNEFFEKVYEGIIGDNAFGLVPIVMRPKSRGRIRLKSRSPFQWPRMEPNYFADPEDLETLVQGAKLVLEMGESDSFRSLGSRFHRHPFLGCEMYAVASDDYWRCCIKGYTSSLQHQVSKTDSTQLIVSTLSKDDYICRESRIMRNARSVKCSNQDILVSKSAR